MKPTLFLATTGSVASRLTGKMIAEAKKSGFGKIVLHPSEASVAFLFESVLRDHSHAAQHASNAPMTENIERKIKDGKTVGHREFADWLTAMASATKNADLESLLESFETGDESEGILTRDIGNVRHIQVADSASVALIAPATANTVAKIVNGTTDTFLLQTIRAMPSDGSVPVFVAPAMNTNMLEDPFTKKNLEALKNEGFPKYRVLPTQSKLLQCGKTGD